MLLAAGFAATSCSEEVDYISSNEAAVNTITTGDATVTAISAVTTGKVYLNGNFASSSYQVGTILSTSEDVTAGSKQIGSIAEDGTVTTNLSNLKSGTTYYYATYITLQGRVTKYGETKSFVATDAAVATADAANVSACKATISGQATGVDEIVANTEVGFKYALSASDVQNGTDIAIAEPSTSFTTSVAGLLPETTYYYAAYSKVGDGYVYGETKSFTTTAQTMEYVDLGLSVMWAKCNIGAETESEIGALAGFGDQTFFSHSTSADDYTPWDIAGTDDDMLAGMKIDGESPMKSKMPTEAQIQELIAKTTQSAETVNGVEGIRFTAANGNSIFLPVSGYRNGDETVSNGEGYYWSGNVSTINDVYAKSLKLTSGAEIGVSARSLGLAVRSIRDYAVLHPNSDKLIVGDLENNGRIRIELYNEYGSSKADPAVDPSSIKFNQNMIVTFKISGIDGNLKEGAPEEFVAGLEYSDPTWGPSYWSILEMGKYEAPVKGDGTYVVWCETTGANGAVVFCIDIKDLGANLVDASKIKAEIVDIQLDATNIFPVVQDAKNFYQGDNPADGRIQIFNPWNGLNSEGYYDDGKLNYTGMFIVDFTITGIDGNLKEGAPAEFTGLLSYADKNWGNDYWGGNSYGNAAIKGDGSYSTYFYNRGNAEGIVFSCVELKNLWENLVDPSKVKVSVDKITIPGKH